MEMRKVATIVLLLALLPLLAGARLLRDYDMSTLIAKCELVFVGRVTSVAASGIRTRLWYPTWRSATFEWLIAEVRVLEPIKGVAKEDVVRVAMLSVVGTKKPYGNLPNGPGILNPEIGDQYLLCLLPTVRTNLYAAFTAPDDEHLSILPLDRSHFNYRALVWDDGTESRFRSCRDAVWKLVDEKGSLDLTGAAILRETYSTEIGMPAPTNKVIHLEWETYRSQNGWETDVPKGYGNVPQSDEETGTQNKTSGR